MRKEVVYSFLALGAIPVTVNADDVQATQLGTIISAPDGTSINQALGTLVPGTYKFSGKLTTKLYGVKVKIGGVEKNYDAFNGEQDVDIEFTLAEAKEVKLEMTSTSQASGSEFTLGSPVLNLSFEFGDALNKLSDRIDVLTAAMNDFGYATKAADLSAAENLKKEINAIKSTYDAYKTNELYDLTGGAMAKRVKQLSSDVYYNQITFEAQLIKDKYNQAVVELKAELVDASAYLLDGALQKLSTDIDDKITAAMTANYKSKEKATADDDAKANRALIPTEDAIKTITDDYKKQSKDNKDAYKALVDEVARLQGLLDAVKVSDGTTLTDAEAKLKTDAQGKINALNALVEGVYNKADQLEYSNENAYKDADAAASTAVANYDSAVKNANAKQALNDAIAKVQSAFNTAKKTGADAKSKNGKYTGNGSYYTDYLNKIQNDINAKSTEVANAYKNKTAAAYSLNTTDIEDRIKAYEENAPKAVTSYDEKQEAFGKYQADLDAARAQFANEAIYTAEGYDFKYELDLIQKDINDLVAEVERIIKEEKGADHWSKMIAAAKDNGDILARIKALVDQKNSSVNEYNAKQLDNAVTALEESITNFGTTYLPTGDTKLGDDFAAYAGVVGQIESEKDAIKAIKTATDTNSETVDYTAKVSTSALAWHAVDGPAGQVEKYGDSKVGVKMYQEVDNLENGIYDIEVYATSYNERGEDGASLQQDATDVAYVFGTGSNSVKTWIKARKGTESGLLEGDPAVYAIKGVKVENGKLTIGLAIDKAGQTGWHTIQIKSLKASTASLVQGWGKKLEDLKARQTAIEAVAKDVAAKVATNASQKSAIAENIDNLQDKINNADPKKGFIAKYALGTDASTLGIRGRAYVDDNTKVGEFIVGEVTNKESKIDTELNTLEGNNNAIDVTAVTNADKTSKVGTRKGDWKSDLTFAEGENYAEISGMVETYKKTVEGTGIVLSQTITGLDNGIYTIVLTANANFTTGRGFDSDLTDGATDAAYVFANDQKVAVESHRNTDWTKKDYTIANVIVTDGTLTLGLAKAQALTNWHAIQIKSLTYRENSQKATLDGYASTYQDLSKRQTALEKDAVDIAAAVKANKDKKAAVDKAMKDNVDDYLLSQLKALADVTDDNGDYSNSKAKKSDPGTWYVYKTGLDDDKTFEAMKAAVVADTVKLRSLIDASFVAEALVKDWNNGITETVTVKKDGKDVTEEHKYYIADIKKAIDLIKATAASESDNYWAYRNTNKSYMNNTSTTITTLGNGSLDKEIDAAGKDLLKATTDDKNEGSAYDYYHGLVTAYHADRDGILTRMRESLNKRTAVADKDGYVNELKALTTKVKAVQPDAKANLKEYNDQMAALANTKKTFNDTYLAITTGDESSAREGYLKQLSAIQEEITAAETTVKESYLKGESVKNHVDFATIDNKIGAVQAQQTEGYSAAIQADNEQAHQNFLDQIAAAKQAYKDAAKARADYRSSNANIEDAIKAAAQTIDEMLYVYDILTQINKLVEDEAAAYAATQSPTKFDPENAFITAALKFEQDITNAKDQFMKDVTAAITGYWNDQAGTETTGFKKALADAQATLKTYKNDGAKTNALKDVEDLVKAGDVAAAVADLAGVEAAIEALADIDDMLANDLYNAAVKDVEISITNAENKKTATDAALNGYADDLVGSTSKTQQQNKVANSYWTYVSEVKYDFDYYKSEGTVDSNRATLIGMLDQFMKDCDDAVNAMKQLVKDDQANTNACNLILDEIQKVEKNLAEAEAVVAKYKYYNDGLSVNAANLASQNENVANWQENGGGVAFKASAIEDAQTEQSNLQQNLVIAYGDERIGLDDDITELMNLYNQYVAAVGENNDEFKDEIAAVTKKLTETKAPKKTDEWADIMKAMNSLLAIQTEIADLQTKIAQAYGNTANATVLADLSKSIADLEAAATLDGNADWVKGVEFNGKTLEEWIEEIQKAIAAVKGEVEADKDNIAFFKDKYEGKVAAIKAELDPVVKEISDRQQQFDDNEAAYAEKMAVLQGLTNQIQAAREKVSAYEYAGYIYDYSYLLDEAEQWIHEDKGDRYYQGYSWYDFYGLDDYYAEKKAQNYKLQNDNKVKNNIQKFLDESAYSELLKQIQNLNSRLTNAIDSEDLKKYATETWSSLQREKSDIKAEINDLSSAVEYSHSDYYYYYKQVTSDADYAAQMEIVAEISAKISTFATDVQNSKLGDITGDGSINTFDFTTVVGYIIGKLEMPEAGTAEFKAADIDGNGKVNVIDATQLVNIILYDNPNGSVASARSTERRSLTVNETVPTMQLDTTGETLSLTQVRLNDNVVRLALMLDNANAYSNMQMDVVLPEGLKLVGQSLGARAAETHDLMTGIVNGTRRFLVMGADNAQLAGNAGAVVYIDVEVGSDYQGGEIEFRDVTFTNSKGDYAEFSLTSGEVTGISSVASEDSLRSKIYNMGGRVIDYLKKGVNIIRKADGTTEKVIKK